TLNADGTRRQIVPQHLSGRFWRARRIVGYALMAASIMLPFVRMDGVPLILLDITSRRFHRYGSTFLTTDGVLLMLLLLTLFIGVIGVTALIGRAWCGWACPQTVYMEFLFRPIERLIDGKRAAQLQKHGRSNLRRAIKLVVFVLLSIA